MGGVCEASCWWPWAGAEVSRALYTPRGDHESAPAGPGGGAGDLSVERLCPWQPSATDDARCRRIYPAVPAPYLTRRLPTSPPLWIARESGPSGQARGVPGAAPAAVGRYLAGAACPCGAPGPGGAEGRLSGL